MKETLHSRLLKAAGLWDYPPAPYQGKYNDLLKSEWSHEFERLMRNRLVMGALRYGLLRRKDSKIYDRVGSMMRRLKKYQETGNKEFLVDVANLCLVKFVCCKHPNAHFHSQDNTTEHVATL